MHVLRRGAILATLHACVALTLFAQAGTGISVRGTIRDAVTGQPVENVNVYLSSTSLGTGSGKNGTYELAGIPPGHYQIVFSRVGYASDAYPLELGSPGPREFDVRLTGRVIALGEVEVSGDANDEAYRKYRSLLDLFLGKFLGPRQNTRLCRVTNPQDLRVRIEGEDILQAAAVRPILLENHALGYSLQIELKDFIWWLIPDIGTILVYPRFTPLSPRDPDEEKLWRKNRRSSYVGSLTHFLKALYAGRSYQEGFRVKIGRIDQLKDGGGLRISPDDFSVTADSGGQYKAWRLGGWALISYERAFPVIRSLVSVHGDSALFDAAGTLSDPTSHYIGGDWARYRMADMLPLNISPVELLEEAEDGR